MIKGRGAEVCRALTLTIWSFLMTWCFIDWMMYVLAENKTQIDIDPQKLNLALKLTLRWEARVKLTADPINCLILKNCLNLYRQDFVTLNIFSLPSIWHF